MPSRISRSGESLRRETPVIRRRHVMWWADLCRSLKRGGTYSTRTTSNTALVSLPMKCNSTAVKISGQYGISCGRRVCQTSQSLPETITRLPYSSRSARYAILLQGGKYKSDTPQGQPAAVKVFNVPNFDAPVSQKNFFKGDKVQLKWNDLGTHLIVLAQTEVDKTGKSYYGETTLYLLSADGGFDSRIDLGMQPRVSAPSS